MRQSLLLAFRRGAEVQDVAIITAQAHANLHTAVQAACFIISDGFLPEGNEGLGLQGLQHLR